MYEKTFDLKSWLLSNHPPSSELSNEEWECDCPKCGREGKLAVNIRKKKWQCWICGFKGFRPSILIAAYESITVDQASALIVQNSLNLGGKIEPLEPHKRRHLKRRLPIANTPPGTVSYLTPKALEYIKKRGVSEKHSRIFGLSSILGDGTNTIANRILAGRLMIPVWIDRQFVYWIARDITGRSKIKVVNLPADDRHEAWGLPPVPGCAKKNEVLVGLHLVNEGDEVFLVEGPMDAIVCGPGFVASLGSTLSTQQALLIASKKPKKVTILYDGDEAGHKGSKKAHELLEAFVPTRAATCPDGTDPADLGRDRCLSLAYNAKGRDYISPLV